MKYQEKIKFEEKSEELQKLWENYVSNEWQTTHKSQLK